MTHLFPHIGDTHLAAAHPRNPDRLASLDAILRHVAALPAPGRGVAALLWPGDLFHGKSTPEDRNALMARVIAAAAIAPVLLTYGNHDEPGDLEYLAQLDTAWPVHVVSSPSIVTLSAAATGRPVACFVLPYPHKAALVAAGVAHQRLADEARAALDAVFVDASAHLAALRAQGYLTLAMGHVNVGGSVASTGQPQIGRELELDPALLARLGVDYIGLNHIHRHQELHGAVYAGSICRMDFGENEPKGFVIASCHEGAAGAERWSWRFADVDVPRQLHINGHLTRAGFVVEAGSDEEAAREVAGADVRVRYTFKQNEVGAIDVAHIHALCAGARSLKLDPVPIVEREVRVPEIAAATTLEEKAQAFCRVNGIAWTPRLADKLAQLQQQEHDAVMAALTTVLAGRAADVAIEADEQPAAPADVVVH